MKHIILFLFVLLALISCVKEEEDSPLLSAPVITLKEESPIYKTKIGREITIAPIYENTDSEKMCIRDRNQEGSQSEDLPFIPL